MIIAIDGVSGSGKSSLAKEVAKELDYGFFSAGYFYRAITYEALKRNILDYQDDMLNILMNNLDIKLLYDESKSLTMFVNGEDITSYLHTEEISNSVAKYSLKPYIRENNKPLTSVQGIEINTMYHDEEIHILGYMMDVNNKDFQELIKFQNAARMKQIWIRSHLIQKN